MVQVIWWGLAAGAAVIGLSYLLFRTVFTPKKLAANKVLGVTVPIGYAILVSFFVKETSRTTDLDVRVAIFIVIAACFFSLFKFLLLPLVKEIQKTGN
jgi:ABC-type uncharacterized transport system permease subunit